MKRYTMAFAMIFLLSGLDAAAGQASARIEYRKGRVGVGVSVGRLPVRVGAHGPLARGWLAADWGPLRVRVATHNAVPVRTAVRQRRTLQRPELRFILGKETVKRIEKHAKKMGIRGRTRGQWFAVDRKTSVLEITVDRIPVAELYDHRNDGYIDELYLIGPRDYGRRGDYRYRPYRGWDDRDDWDDWGDWDDWDDWDDWGDWNDR